MNYKTIKKILSVLFLIIFSVLALGFGYFLIGIPKGIENVEYGVTFSTKSVRGYDQDPQQVFREILHDLKVRKLRLVAYWDLIETEKDNYDFSELDWQIEEAEEADAEIILALGQKLPRWAECHIPEWVRELDRQKRRDELLEIVQKIVERYKNSEAVKIWQVENEPFFFHSFGICPELDKELFDSEIELVRALDNRPIMLTSSGELSLWIGEFRRADVFGTSLYKYVYNQTLGYMQYRIPAIFYQRKVALMRFLFGNKPVIVSEQQAEPWVHGDIKTLAPEIIAETMTPEKFQEIIDYSKKCGFTEVYLWGVEWWAWQKEQGNDTYWELARGLFEND